MNQLRNIYMDEEAEYVKKMMSDHIQAMLKIVDSRNQIGNRLALSEWGKPGHEDFISLPRSISMNEQISAILQIISKGEDWGIPRLAKIGRQLLASDSRMFLAYLVLHEIAHIKHAWSEKREIDCHLWAGEQLEKIRASGDILS